MQRHVHRQRRQCRRARRVRLEVRLHRTGGQDRKARSQAGPSRLVHPPGAGGASPAPMGCQASRHVRQCGTPGRTVRPRRSSAPAETTRATSGTAASRSDTTTRRRARPRIRALSRDHAVRLVIRVAPDVTRIRVIRGRGRTIYRGRPRDIKDLRLRNYTRYRYTVIASDARRPSVARVGLRRAEAPAALAAQPGRADRRRRCCAGRRCGARTTTTFSCCATEGRCSPPGPRGRGCSSSGAGDFEGRVRRMRPGTYEWNVWPGYGPRRRANYGSQIGKGRTFVIPGAPPAP